MSIGGSIFVIALGAILRYAVNTKVAGVDLDVVGLVLMIAGAVALVISLVYTFGSSRQASPPPSGA